MGQTTLTGTEGNDELWGAGQEVYGLDGNDIIHGGKYIDGGAGNDKIYASSEDATIIGGDGNDSVLDSYGSHTVITGAGDDYYGFDPDHYFNEDIDVVDLGIGNDTASISFVADEMHSTIAGGEGFDTLLVMAPNVSRGPEIVDFRSTGGEVQLDGFRISGFERISFKATETTKLVYFGGFDDAFIGLGYKATTVYAGGGNDYLDSGGGANLHGGEGNDIIIAQGGTQAIINRAFGDAGDDLIFANYKVADYASHGELTGGSGVDGFITVGHRQSDEADYIMDFDPASDWLGLSNVGHRAVAGETQRLILEKTNIANNSAELSFDTKFPAPMMTESGFATYRITYDKKTGEVFFEDKSQAFPEKIVQFILKGAPHLTLDDFYGMSIQIPTLDDDVLHGTAFSDGLRGDAGSDYIYGGLGNDIIYGDGGGPFTGIPDGSDHLFGEGGNDILNGDASDDVLIGGTGADQITGGVGSDSASYETADKGVTVFLSRPSTNSGDAAGDIFKSIENITGSKYDDKLSGDSSKNVLNGNVGNDVLIGSAGADTLLGGSGSDTASYETADAGVSVYMTKMQNSTGDALGDTFKSIENLTGSRFNDVLYADGSVSTLNGGLGNDILYGNEGADKLIGGAGADTFLFKEVSDSRLTSFDVIYDFGGADGDIMDVSGLDASTKTSGNNAFNWIGTSAFTGHAGEIRYEKLAADTNIYADTNGDGKADFMIHLADAQTLDNGFFIL
ncbi:calcium-binding protein [Rhizobium sp. CC1099]|uniref:calcium-binding protein n=1 Tax=Rhizobium sp. CC1099 TaxID=3039160 RepID=UPI0024B067EE|nr:calcium-binding protein [Rhizobium sp. CC1099]WFU86312.1 calcium-binding protein [Rhizobium sp. CC1099]